MPAPTANQKTGDYAMIQISTDGTTWTNLGIVEEITGNKIKAAEIEVSKLSDAADVFQPGRPNFGSIETKLRFAASMNATIAGYMVNKTPLWVRVVPSDVTLGLITPANGSNNSYEVAQGFVSEFDPYGQMQASKEIISSVSFKLSGAGTLTNAGA